MSLDIKDQIYWLKGLTERFGVLHEAQVQQLKVYPLFIKGVKSATINVDVPHRTVFFDCSTEKFRKTKNRLAEMSAITDYVQRLLWDDTVVVFKSNGNQIYDSKFDYVEQEGETELGSVSK